ncbi:hypothetical protein SAY87_002700 [Trapa incisa]|uniref:DUF7722 domain-containing protein n=1 Tax=Trapa incisa TaxID=236973 RepID=A0AAN7JUU9_9MYRT|nr:hypothetical protein SAY87_002700 [Trapa incisa]
MEVGPKKDTVGHSGLFQMPLHYPRYTRQDYHAMPEWKLDGLLEQYGLPTDIGDLDYKREFAIGAFLWPDTADQHLLRRPPLPPPVMASSPLCSSSRIKDSSILQKKIK